MQCNYTCVDFDVDVIKISLSEKHLTENWVGWQVNERNGWNGWGSNFYLFVLSFAETGNLGNASVIYSATFEDIPAAEPIIYRPNVGDSPYLRSVKNDRYVFMRMLQLWL